jgi:biopolymer transport protein ExbD
MADARQFLDVWIVESNTVYREVPFTVVCDWVQEGRLLEDDHVRKSGTAEWRRIGDVRAFAAFLPKPEPARAADQAEALDRVEFEFGWNKKHIRHEDEEVDMIPLIDVSLVLLIFFMITGGAVGVASLVKLAGVKDAPKYDTKGISINMDVDAKGGKQTVIFAIGDDGVESHKPEDNNIKDRRALFVRLNAYLDKKKDGVDVTINPHTDLEDGEMVKMIRDVRDPRLVPNTQKIGSVFIGVTEAKR